jgi:hypothetical protein
MLLNLWLGRKWLLRSLSMADAAPPPGNTYQDVVNAPEHVVAELIAVVRGGWVILDEPELHLQGDVLVPDLAGWRRHGDERVRVVPFDAIELEVAVLWAR